ncbi:hypothetical protein H6G65_08430 [Microcystis elabens FACHB-917]|nr:hypothetical protein [Microcystis elabens FACHB-917]
MTSTLEEAERKGRAFYEFRKSLILDLDEGLTAVHNRINNPAEQSMAIQNLRRISADMDSSVLHLYGWSDIPAACGFALDYLDTEDDAQLPEHLQERIGEGNLFFWDAHEALDFQGQLQAYGAITGRRKLPWRYRWPDAVRDDLLARLLALNAERYAEEVAHGLHGKGGKQAAKASGPATGKRRAPPAFASQAGETVRQQTEQMGLGL